MSLSIGAQTAAEVLADVQWPEDRLPIDPIAIANCYGIEVHKDDDMTGTSASGVCLVDKKGKSIIFYNPSEKLERIRFTIAHELGHALMHDDGIHNRSNQLIEEYKKEEAEANDFAANLLMPEDKVRLFVSSNKVSMESLVESFGVSITTMGIRLRHLGLL